MTALLRRINEKRAVIDRAYRIIVPWSQPESAFGRCLAA
jgi:hypothetical protein